MQSSTSRSVAIGIFVFVGMLIAGWLIFAFGDAPTLLTGGTYPVRINFKQIGITKEGTEVLLAGKRIGQVSKINFLDEQFLSRGVQVVTEIEKKYKLPQTAHALESVTSAVMGRAVIQIVVREGPTAEPLKMDGSALIQGEVQPLLDNILPPQMLPAMEQSVRQIGELAAALTPVAHELELLVKSRTLKDVDQPGAHAALANISTVVQRLDITLKNINTVIGDQANQVNLKDSIANFRKASEDAIKVMDQLNRLGSETRVVVEDVRGGVKDARALIAKADGMMDGLSGTGMDTLEAFSRTALEMEELLHRANEGKGTLGLLANDNRLYESLLLTTERMNKTLDDVRALLEQWKRGEVKVKVF